MKSKIYFFLFFAVLIAACTDNNGGNKTEENPTTEETASGVDTVAAVASADTIAAPAGYKKLGEATGDLDKDGVAEKVAVFDTERNTDMGTEREIQVFKKTDGAWTLWHKSIGAVLPSENGGVMGDPFQDIKIENGSIVLFHFGGSRYKWTYTHRFRFQNSAWQLIGATVNNGTPCEYWENIDYNLSTGKVKYEKETEDCEGGEDNVKTTKKSKDFTKKLAKLPPMDGFKPGENELKLPGLDNAFYY